MRAELRFIHDQRYCPGAPYGPCAAVVVFDQPVVGNDQPRERVLSPADWPAAVDIPCRPRTGGGGLRAELAELGELRKGDG
jgi:hypothetical protein